MTEDHRRDYNMRCGEKIRQDARCGGRCVGYDKPFTIERDDQRGKVAVRWRKWEDVGSTMGRNGKGLGVNMTRRATEVAGLSTAPQTDKDRGRDADESRVGR